MQGLPAAALCELLMPYIPSSPILHTITQSSRLLEALNNGRPRLLECAETKLLSEMCVSCIRAMVPTLHTANTVGKRSSSKYKVGQEVTGRILEVDAAKKRVSMTLKKLLCSDKLPVITTFQVSFCFCQASVSMVKYWSLVRL